MTSTIRREREPCRPGAPSARFGALRSDHDGYSAELVNRDLERHARACRSLSKSRPLNDRSYGRGCRGCARLVKPFGQVQELLDARGPRSESVRKSRFMLRPSRAGVLNGGARRGLVENAHAFLELGFGTTEGRHTRGRNACHDHEHAAFGARERHRARSRPRSGTARSKPRPRSQTNQSGWREHKLETPGQEFTLFLAPSMSRSSSRRARTVNAAVDAGHCPRSRS